VTGSIFNPGGVGATGPRMTDYHAAITRDYPTWTATITGGGIPEPGHVITSLSYARLCDEMQDWLEWHYDHEPALGDDGQACDDSADDEDDGAGEGFQILNNFGFSQPVSDAQERYWQAQQQLAQSHAIMRQAVWDIYEGLIASAEDLARLLCISPRHVRRIMEHYEPD
jgi:hypothetical protein